MRPLPSGLGAASTDPGAPLTPDFEVPWLQPLPGRYTEDPQARAGVRLAFVAATQLLPPRQRAVLVLRDVLQFSAAEVATQLDTSAAAVNSSLQRARAALAAATPRDHEVREPGDREVRETVERYVRAFEAADVPALVTLLAEDAVLEMPPVPLWYAGRADYGRFMARVFAMRPGGWRAVPLTANGQPALAAYCLDDAAWPPPAHPAGADGDAYRDRAQRRVPGPAGVRGLRPRRVRPLRTTCSPPCGTAPSPGARTPR